MLRALLLVSSCLAIFSACLPGLNPTPDAGAACPGTGCEDLGVGGGAGGGLGGSSATGGASGGGVGGSPVTGGGAGGSLGSGGGSGGGAGGGGGADAGVAAPFTSGSRLKYRWAVSPGGDRAYLATYDSQRAQECTFVSGADGAVRCLPMGEFWFGTYSDAACTQRMVRVTTTGCGAPPAALQLEMAGCQTRYHVFPIGAALQPTTEYTLNPSTGACTGASPPAGRTYYAMASELPASSFVSAQVTPGSAASGLSVSKLTAADGLTQDWWLHDPGLDEDCYARRLDGAVRCVPVQVAFPSGFSDAACTVAAYSGSTCAIPKIGQRPTTACAPQFVQLGGALTTSYARSGSACVASATASGTFSSAGDLPLSTFPSATVTTTAGRLQQVRLEWPGGARGFLDFVDTQLGVACQAWRLTTDGRRRCVPLTDSAVGGYFKDSGCTQRLAHRWDGAACPADSFAIEFLQSCAGLLNQVMVKVWAIGAPHTGPVYSGTPGACVQQTSSMVFFSLGAELQPAQMEPLSEVTD